MLTNIWMVELEDNKICMTHTVKLEIEEETPEELDRVLAEALDYLNEWTKDVGEELDADVTTVSYAFENSPMCGIQAASGNWYKPDGVWIIGESYL